MPPQGAQPHAGGTQVGRTVPLDGVQRHAVGMQVACRWGAVEKAAACRCHVLSRRTVQLHAVCMQAACMYGVRCVHSRRRGCSGMQAACMWGALCPSPPQGVQSRAGGMQVGALCRHVHRPRRRCTQRTQLACRWGAPCPPKKVQRHAVGHAGGARQPQQKNQPNLVDFSIADEFLGPCCGMKASQLQEQVHNRVQKTLQDPPITYDRKLSV